MNIFDRFRMRRKAEKQKHPEVRQAQLKHELGFEDQERVVVVEKNNMAKFMIKSIASLVHLIATIIILALAFCGLVALVYPVPREALIAILIDGVERIQELLLVVSF